MREQVVIAMRLVSRVSFTPPPPTGYMPKPSGALAIQLKSKTLNFKFRIPQTLLPAARFSLILKFRQCRLILKSVPHSRSWLKSRLCKITTIPFINPKPKSKAPIIDDKSELFSSKGVQKVSIVVIVYMVNMLFACRMRVKLLFILSMAILSIWALLNFSDLTMSSVWWFVKCFIDFKDILSKANAAMGRIEDPVLRFF